MFSIGFISYTKTGWFLLLDDGNYIFNHPKTTSTDHTPNTYSVSSSLYVVAHKDNGRVFLTKITNPSTISFTYQYIPSSDNGSPNLAPMSDLVNYPLDVTSTSIYFASANAGFYSSIDFDNAREHTWVVKTDLNGNVTWSTFFSVVQTASKLHPKAIYYSANETKIALTLSEASLKPAYLLLLNDSTGNCEYAIEFSGSDNTKKSEVLAIQDVSDSMVVGGYVGATGVGTYGQPFYATIDVSSGVSISCYTIGTLGSHYGRINALSSRNGLCLGGVINGASFLMKASTQFTVNGCSEIYAITKGRDSDGVTDVFYVLGSTSVANRVALMKFGWSTLTFIGAVTIQADASYLTPKSLYFFNGFPSGVPNSIIVCCGIPDYSIAGRDDIFTINLPTNFTSAVGSYNTKDSAGNTKITTIASWSPTITTTAYAVSTNYSNTSSANTAKTTQPVWGYFIDPPNNLFAQNALTVNRTTTTFYSQTLNL